MSRIRHRLFLIPIVMAAVFSLSAVSARELRTTVEWLSDPARDGRGSQSAGAIATAEYLLERFMELGLDAEAQRIGPGRQNVVARWGNRGPHIIIGAHFDGQGRGYASASDNAAGVAVMLELARDLRETELVPSLVFIAFDDEERGLNGSRHYADEPLYPLEDAIAVVILDTMGRSFIDLDRWSLIVFGTEFSPKLGAIATRRGGSTLVPLGTDLLGSRSDFAPFAALSIPYLFFTNATHEDYHGPGDTPAKLDYDRLLSDTETVRSVIVDIAALDSAPVYLGTPSYPAREAEQLRAYMDAIEAEHEALSPVYPALFDDLGGRLETDPTRETLRLATSVMLAAATPRMSSFGLAYLIGPLYEAEGKTALAIAVYQEAVLRMPNEFARRPIEEKIRALQD